MYVVCIFARVRQLNYDVKNKDSYAHPLTSDDPARVYRIQAQRVAAYTYVISLKVGESMTTTTTTTSHILL